MDARGQETRERIISATIEVIAREGWRGVTVRKIAAAAGVNSALVNYHFGSKTNLMLIALESALEEQVVTPMLDAFADAEPRRVLADLVRLTLGPQVPADAHRVFESALAAVVHDPDLAVRVRPTLQRFRAVLAEIFERAIAAGEMPPSDADALAIVCTALLDGLWLHRLIDPDLPAERIANTAGELLPKA